MKVIVTDTSVIIDGRITQLIKKGEFKGARVIVPNAVLAELEHQANLGKEIGFAGLAEVRELNELGKQGVIAFQCFGERPTIDEIRGAKLGDIDAKIRDIAKKLRATLITSDKVQNEVAKAEGVDVHYIEVEIIEKELGFKKYFDKDTSSVHLKEGTIPLAKTGRPGSIKLVKLGENKVDKKDLRDMSKEIVEAARRGETNCYIEIDRKGATVVQLNEYRITITNPPFSDGVEITIVRPLVKISLVEYNLSEKLRGRFRERAEGIIICGSPGSGKSTLASALAEYYAKEKNAIVKTLESPRDLQVIDEITQYAPLEGSFEKTSDILLLVRPDYSIYDEIRKTEDFKIFADMRLAGIGMVGVLHANKPIDAVQRFIGRVDLGMIPQIIDTIVFVKNGQVGRVYELEFSVKVPYGMTEQDLARPVIEIVDFESGEAEYEIYKFGDETVVFPIPKNYKVQAKEVVQKLQGIMQSYIKNEFRVESSGGRVILYVNERDVASVIGKKGQNISKIEKKLGARIEVRELK
ncbi:Flp pilus assembly complex ATPase component TadA [Candidatus Micrarchaeota archaeon]|nr:Flp pilus assembly complex ATPase component TadA [Candidatus Micrarchaeota archaeon]